MWNETVSSRPVVSHDAGLHPRGRRPRVAPISSSPVGTPNSPEARAGSRSRQRHRRRRPPARERPDDVFAAGDVRGSRAPLGKPVRVEHEDHANSHGRFVGPVDGGCDPSEYDHLPLFYSDLFDLGYEAVGDSTHGTTSWRLEGASARVSSPTSRAAASEACCCGTPGARWTLRAPSSQSRVRTAPNRCAVASPASPPRCPRCCGARRPHRYACEGTTMEPKNEPLEPTRSSRRPSRRDRGTTCCRRTSARSRASRNPSRAPRRRRQPGPQP